MDAVSSILDGHRVRGAFLLRCVMAPPWAVRIADQSAVALLVMVHGHAYVRHDGVAPIRLEPDDVAVLKGAKPYVLAGDPTTPPTVQVDPGQVCRSLDAGEVPLSFGPGLRTWGNTRAGGPCAFLTGTYELPSQVTGRLLDHVPDVVVVRAAEHDAPAVRLLGHEFDRDAPGQDAVLDRLVDLVLINALRTWFAAHADAAPAWWRAHDDPVVGAALRLIHDRPDQPWTLESLAAEVAVSRATLARRFGQLVEQPPMAYLGEWRLSMAADLLRDSSDTVEAIARRVGYANPFAFSTAFKRRFGVAPRAFRLANRPA
jgi:AraC-like DNA-binding protein